MHFLRLLYEKATPNFIRRRLGYARCFLTKPRTRQEWINSLKAKRMHRLADKMLSTGQTTAITQLPHARLIVDLRDQWVGRLIYTTNQYEVAETQYLRHALRPGMVVYDIGANIGYMTTLAASLVGADGLVVSFEPDPYNFELLTKNVALNDIKNVHLFNTALGNQSGTAKLFRSESNYGDHQLYAAESDSRVAVEVKVQQLDDLRARENLPKPDFIKIDVQGFEPFVLAGMMNTLNSCASLTVLTEYWPFGIRNAKADPQGHLAMYRDKGFDVATLSTEGELIPTGWSALDAVLDAAQVYESEAHVNLLMYRGQPGTISL